MSRFLGARWAITQDITLQFVDDGNCPFDVAVAASQLSNHADWITFVTGREIQYGGIVSEDLEESGIIYVRFADVVGDPFWAWSTPRTEYGTKMVGGLITFRSGPVDIPEKYAGIFPHELCHALGFAHWNGGRSIMNDSPYHSYDRQGTYMLEDLRSFGMLFPGPSPDNYPSAFDFGDISQGRCIIHIPCIQWQPGQYSSVYLSGKQESGEWILTIESRDVYPANSTNTVAYLMGGILTIPIRYGGQSLEIKAELIEYNPSTKTKFRVISLS